MAAPRMELDNRSGQSVLNYSFLKEHAPAAAKIAAFLMDSTISIRIESAFFTVNDVRLQLILSDGVSVY